MNWDTSRLTGFGAGSEHVRKNREWKKRQEIIGTLGPSISILKRKGKEKKKQNYESKSAQWWKSGCFWFHFCICLYLKVFFFFQIKERRKDEWRGQGKNGKEERSGVKEKETVRVGEGGKFGWVGGSEDQRGWGRVRRIRDSQGALKFVIRVCSLNDRIPICGVSCYCSFTFLVAYFVCGAGDLNQNLRPSRWVFYHCLVPPPYNSASVMSRDHLWLIPGCLSLQNSMEVHLGQGTNAIQRDKEPCASGFQKDSSSTSALPTPILGATNTKGKRGTQVCWQSKPKSIPWTSFQPLGNACCNFLDSREQCAWLVLRRLSNFAFFKFLSLQHAHY